jgi:hypothetical protein
MSYVDGELVVSGHDKTVRRSDGSWVSPSEFGASHLTVLSPSSALGVADARVVSVGGEPSAPAALLADEVVALGEAGDDFYVLNVAGRLSRSSDDGASFDRVYGGQPQLIGAIAVDFADHDVAFGVTEDGALVGTADGGRSWTTLGAITDALAVATNGRASGQVAVTTADGVVLSLDGGQTWTDTQAPETMDAIAFSPRGQPVGATTIDDRLLAFEYEGGVWSVVG